MFPCRDASGCGKKWDTTEIVEFHESQAGFSIFVFPSRMTVPVPVGPGSGAMGWTGLSIRAVAPHVLSERAICRPGRFEVVTTVIAIVFLPFETKMMKRSARMRAGLQSSDHEPRTDAPVTGF